MLAAKKSPAPEPGPSEPARVGVSFELTLNTVNDSQEAFSVELDLKFTWRARGFAEQYAAAGSPKRGSDKLNELITGCWKPNLYISNVAGYIEVVSDLTICIDPANGVMHQFRKYRAELAESLELQAFPFDNQLLAIHLATYRDTSEVEFVPYPGRASLIKSRAGRWEVYNTQAPMLVIPGVAAPGLVATSGRAYHKCFVVIEAARNSYWYRVHLLVPFCVIVVMNANVVLIDRHDVADRCAVALTLLLTSVAFQYVLAAEVPKKNYPTLLDNAMNFGLALQFFTCAMIYAHATNPHAPESGTWFAPLSTEAVYRNEYIFLFVLIVPWALFNLMLFMWPYFFQQHVTTATLLRSQGWLDSALGFEKKLERMSKAQPWWPFARRGLAGHGAGPPEGSPAVEYTIARCGRELTEEIVRVDPGGAVHSSLRRAMQHARRISRGAASSRSGSAWSWAWQRTPSQTQAHGLRGATAS